VSPAETLLRLHQDQRAQDQRATTLVDVSAPEPQRPALSSKMGHGLTGVALGSAPAPELWAATVGAASVGGKRVGATVGRTGGQQRSRERAGLSSAGQEGAGLLGWAQSEDWSVGVIESEQARRRLAGAKVAVGRVLKVEGFSTLPGSDDDLFFVDEASGVEGGPLGALGGPALVEAARRLLATAPAQPVMELSVEVGDKEAVAAGLACGGRVHLVLQAGSSVPEQLWERLAAREPVALVSWLAEPRPAAVVTEDEVAGGLPSAELREIALRALREGHSTRNVVEHEGTRVLVEAWVPQPRLVVVGEGELVGAIGAQAALLGWETRSCIGLGEVEELLRWAGPSGALIVLSHDPHIDVPVLAAGLAHGTRYVGALGSRHTQSRRTAQLSVLGISEAELARLHRPVGLDLGGRRAPEVALAIVAEILAAHYGRSGAPLRDVSGPIHG